MMRFQVFLSLWSVTSCLCIDKIPEVSKPKSSFSGTRAASPRFGNALCVTGSESAV